MANGWVLDKEYPDHDTLIEVSVPARWMMTVLILKADDEGRATAGAGSWGKNAGMPRDEAGDCLQELAAASMAVFYQDEGRGYLFLPGRFQHNSKSRKWCVSRHPLPPVDLLERHPEYLIGLARLTSRNRLANDLGDGETWRYPHLQGLVERGGNGWKRVEKVGTRYGVGDGVGVGNSRKGALSTREEYGDVVSEGGQVSPCSDAAATFIQGPGSGVRGDTPAKVAAADRQTPNQFAMNLARERGKLREAEDRFGPAPWNPRQIDQIVSWLRPLPKVSEGGRPARPSTGARGGAPEHVSDIIAGLPIKGVN